MSSQASSATEPVMPELKNFINGHYVASSSGTTFDNFDPVTGEVFSVVHEASKSDVDAAVMAARAAFNGEWGSLSIETRVNLLHKVADRINELSLIHI